MLVRFAPQLEAPHPARLGNVVGEVTLGAAGLLGMLETQLGLPPVAPKPGQALIAYRACLADADDFARFYHASFATDPVGTTRVLATWRARWYDAGWDGAFPSGVPTRLADMSEVEKRCRGRVPLTRGERLARVVHELERGSATRIETIELHTDASSLPVAWQAVLARFPVTVAPGVWPEPRAASSTDLGRLQRRLKANADGARVTTAREPLAGDGTVLQISAVSRDVSAHAVAEYLLRVGTADAVVLAERDGIIVDNALERVGLARAGFQHFTPFRGVTQVLRLVLALVWHPVSPDLVLQFLSHPVGPLPRPIRGALAEAVAAQPGIGGRRWAEVVRELTPELANDVAWWLEGERFDPRSGAPAATLTARARRVRTWLATRLATVTTGSDRVLYGAAIAQCDGVVAMLEQLTVAKALVPKVELDLLLDEVMADAPDPGTIAQAGHVSAASRAAQLTEPFSTVIWWDPSGGTGEAGYPWSSTEIAALRANGVALPETRDVVRLRAREWLRPILNATERLLLAVHAREEGSHPVLGQIEAAASNIPVWRAEQALLDGALPTLAPAPLDLPAAPLEPHALPERRRWWTLPSDVVVRPRDGESFSSLGKLFDHPHGWVLRYAARLRPGRAAELPSGPLLFGNLAHRLMELWFAEHGVRTDPATLRPWLATHLHRLLEREGATLLAPGAGVERQRVVALLERALERLVAMLAKTSVERVDTEVDAKASFEDTALTGAIDLLLTDAQGGETVVDVKWGGEPWRMQELAENRQLQLATYAYLRERKTGRWPGFAFFIVATGNVLAQAAGPFRDAVVVRTNATEGIDGVWRRMVRTYAWRRAQLATGQVEVVVDGTLPTEASVPPFDGLAVRDAPDRYDDYAWLTGVLR